MRTILSLSLPSLSIASFAAPPDATGLNAKLKACTYRYAPTGDPCIDKDERGISIQGDRIVFSERHEYTPYSGGNACRNYTVEREDQAALAELVPDVLLDNRGKVSWLTFGYNSGASCVSNVKALRSGQPIEKDKVTPGPTQSKIVTAIRCKDIGEATAIAGELKAFLGASQRK
jgi:hypothetical protein